MIWSDVVTKETLNPDLNLEQQMKLSGERELIVESRHVAVKDLTHEASVFQLRLLGRDFLQKATF